MLNLYAWYLKTAADLRERLSKEEGQTLIEYALIMVLIILIAVATFPQIGSRLNFIFQSVYSQLAGS